MSEPSSATTSDASEPAAPGSSPAVSADGQDASLAPVFSIIVPTYNEAQNLPILVAMLHTELTGPEYRFEVIVVDDSSPDGTFQVAKRLAEVYPAVRPYRREGKLGLGSAYKYAAKHVTGEFVVIMDSDLSHHPKFIPTMLETMRKTSADIVTGSRYRVGSSGGVHGWDMQRKAVSRVANLLAQEVLGTVVSDVTGSYRLYKGAKFAQLVPAIRSDGYAFQMEAVYRAHYEFGIKVTEVDITFVDRLFGESKCGPREIIMYLRAITEAFLTV